jgi:hypothetical protein
MTTKDKIIEAMNAPNAEAIERHGAKPWQARLWQAQRALAAVTKDSRVAFGSQRYAYTSAEDMIAACREAMLSAGLCLTRAYEIRNTEVGAFIDSTFVMHTEDGNSVVMGMKVPWPIVETNGKGEDKSLATALTSSLGYFLRDLLQVPKEDDSQQTVRAPEMDARDDRGRSPSDVLGVQGQMVLEERCKAAGTDIVTLRAAMEAVGLQMPEVPARWPKTLKPRIDRWLEARAAKPEDAAQQQAERPRLEHTR